MLKVHFGHFWHVQNRFWDVLQMYRRANHYWVALKYELYGSWLLDGAHRVTKLDPHAPYDLLFEDYRINVKASKLFKYKRGWYFSFKLHMNHSNCDFFLFFGYRHRCDRTPLKAWLIPSSLLLDKQQFCLSRNPTKWKQYELEVRERPRRRDRNDSENKTIQAS